MTDTQDGVAATAAETGRVLRFLGPADPDPLNPASHCTIRSGQVLRLITRSLFGYRASSECAGPEEAFTPMPDLAAELPTEANGGISADGRHYRIRLRSNVDWDTPLRRKVTAHDVVRGLKRVVHPTASAFRRYLTDTVEGVADYCMAYDTAFADREPTAPDLAQFHVTHPIAGLRAVDVRTVEIDLIQPTRDLPHILASCFTAAAPREYDYYLPDSPELLLNTPSAGPYRIVRPFAPGPDLLLEANPRWQQETDPLRRRCVDQIRIHASGDGWPGAGELDVAWSYGTASWEPGPTPAAGTYLGHTLGPALVFNIRNPTGGAVQELGVRRALAAAVDRAAVTEVVGRATGGHARALQGMILPGDLGYTLEPAADRPGDPALARELLAGAGYSRLRVVLAVPHSDLHWQVARVVGECLWPCGISMHIRSYPAKGYRDTLRNVAVDGGWDMALTDWTPHWHGDNGRTAVAPLLRGGVEADVANVGWYVSEDVDRVISAALREPDANVAAKRWREVEAAAARDLPLVPLVAVGGPVAAASSAASAWARWGTEASWH